MGGDRLDKGVESGFINRIFDTFMELKGDRKTGEDRGIIGGLARLDGQKFIVIIYDNSVYQQDQPSGLAEGHRKACRLMNLSEELNKPLIKIMQFYELPVLPAPIQLQVSESISQALKRSSQLMIPFISLIVGKSIPISSVDLCVADRVLMLEDARFVDMTGKRIITPQELTEIGVVHEIVSGGGNEPLEEAAREHVLREMNELNALDPKELLRQRIEKFQKYYFAFKSLFL